MLGYQEEFDRLYSSDVKYKPKVGWTRFMLTNKDNCDKESGYLRVLYDSNLNIIRKQMVYEKNGKFRIADIEIEYGDEKLDNAFYPYPFESLEEAMFILKEFTIDTMYGYVFDKTAHNIYKDVMTFDVSSRDLINLIKEYQMGDIIDYDQGQNIREEAVARLSYA